MSRVIIRPAQAADARPIATMLAHLADDLGDGDVFSSDGDTVLRYGFGPDPMFYCMLAQVAQKHVGFALYFPHFSTTKGLPGVYVQDLWVDPAVRNAAIGAKLLRAVATRSAEKWTAAYMKLSVHADNPRAEQFYQRMGFSVNSKETQMTAEVDAFAALQEAP